MRITVLGKSPAWQDAGGACSGYLVETATTGLLVDCGPGVLAQLRAHRDYGTLDAVVLTHLHADHILDLVTLASALTYSPRGAAGALLRPALHVPPGAGEQLAALGVAAGMSAGHIAGAFALREYDPAETVTVGDLRLRFQPVPHHIPSHAIEVSDGEVRVTFGSDCGPNDALPEFARGTDLLVVEATLLESDAGDPPAHLSAREAGQHGRRAQARRLLVTHFTDEVDAGAVRAEAAAGYGAAVELAAGGAVFEVKVHPSAADAVK